MVSQLDKELKGGELSRGKSSWTSQPYLWSLVSLRLNHLNYSNDFLLGCSSFLGGMQGFALRASVTKVYLNFKDKNGEVFEDEKT